MTLVLVLSVAAGVGATPPKLAVMPLAAGEGVPTSTAAALTNAVVSELGGQNAGRVISTREIEAVLSLEAQQQLVGCQAEACWAEIGNALAVDELVVGDVAKLGSSWLLHLKRIDVRTITVVGQADKRVKGGSIDDLLDALPAVVGTLVGDARRAAPPSPAVVSPAAAPPAASLAKLPSFADEPWSLTADERSQLKLYSDGKGRYIGVIPFADTSAPFVAGDRERLYRQRVSGGGHDSSTYFDLVFWEPRVTRGAESQFGSRDGRVSLTCGAQQIAFTEVAAKEANAILAKATLLAPRWRRYAHALARDEQAVYYFVDGARAADGQPAPEPELRLYIGRKGKLARVAVDDVAGPVGGELLVTSRGTLRLGREADGRAVAEWSEAGRKVALTALEPSDNVVLIYKDLGVYAGEAFGTPCDGRL